jgi:hypothetical protein
MRRNYARLWALAGFVLLGGCARPERRLELEQVLVQRPLKR